MTEKHAGGRPRKYETVEAMQERIEAYFKKCDARVVPMIVTKDKGKAVVKVPRPEPYTVQGLAVFLGLTTKGLVDYSKREEFCSTIKHARARIEADKVIHMLDGEGWGPGYIFDLKNNFGWTDRQQIEVGGKGGGPIEHKELDAMPTKKLLELLKLIRGESAETKEGASEPERSTD